MRPVGAPQDAVRIGFDEGFGEGRDVRIIGGLGGRAIRARNFHVRAAGTEQLQKIGEAGLLHSEFGLHAAEMIEHGRHGRSVDQILDGGYY